MKKAIILTLTGLCLRLSESQAADTTATAGAVIDTTQKIETTVPIKQPPMMCGDSMENFGGGMYFGWGAYRQPLENLNEVLTDRGFKTLNKNMTMFSCGFFGLTKPRSPFGLDFEYFWSEPASARADTSPIGSVEAHGFQIGVKGGYDLIGYPKWGLLPMFGVGYYSHTYDFKPRFNNFNDIFNGNSKDAVSLNYSGISLSAGLNVHVQTKFDKDRKENGKLHEPTAGLNLEGGIHYYPLRTMRVGNRKVDDAPQMSRYGVYMKLYLDLGERLSPLPEQKKN